MAKIQDITSADWQLSLTPEKIVQDVADIQQCIFIILTTEKGTDPTRPDFGCGIYGYIDKPVNYAVPNMKREIAKAIATYERRVKIIRILHTVESGEVTFKIEWQYSLTTGETTVSYGTGS